MDMAEPVVDEDGVDGVVRRCAGILLDAVNNGGPCANWAKDDVTGSMHCDRFMSLVRFLKLECYCDGIGEGEAR